MKELHDSFYKFPRRQTNNFVSHVIQSGLDPDIVNRMTWRKCDLVDSTRFQPCSKIHLSYEHKQEIIEQNIMGKIKSK